MRGLLHANRLVMSQLGLDAVLREIIEAACDLVDAPYGAIGVIAPSGTELESFVHVGIDDSMVDLIGHLPEGKGLLGVLVEEPRAIRLPDLRLHARSVGFSTAHPPMRAFLGVPIFVGSEVFGNLYLTRPDEREFTAEDEELVSALAVNAGMAIQNARLFEDARRRQDWLQASTDVTRALLMGDSSLAEIARTVGRLANADIVTIVLGSPDEGRLTVAVAEGRDAALLEGMSYALAGTVSGKVLRTGRPVRIDDAARSDGGVITLASVVDVGPVMVLPLVGPTRVRGTLVVGRAPGQRPFTGAEGEMATTFATHCALALELADARANQQRMLLLDDHERIARDMHDHVIQQLFAAGLAVQSVAAGIRDDGMVARLNGVVAGLDDAIRRIRATIFGLHLRGDRGLRSTVLDVVAEVRDALGLDPQVRFTGPVDSVVAPVLVDEVAAVVREALTNVAKHARATMSTVEVRASGAGLVVAVRDDGVGLWGVTRSSGLANLCQRARDLGGTLRTEGGIGGRGLALIWSVPLC